MTDCEEKEKKKGEGEDEDENEDEEMDEIDEMDKRNSPMKGFKEIVPKAQNPTKPLRILNHPQNQSTLIMFL